MRDTTQTPQEAKDGPATLTDTARIQAKQAGMRTLRAHNRATPRPDLGGTRRV